MKTVVLRVTETGGRDATTRYIPPKLALAVGMPATLAPKDWRWTPLTELARLESGHTPSRKHPEYWGGTLPWIGIQDAKTNHGRCIEDTQEKTNELGIENSSARILPENTVCLSRTASVGYVVVMGHPMATSQDFVNWVCSKYLDHNFLKYLFIAEGEELLRFASGAVHQTIYFPEAKAFHICHPALPEQQRIVGILDEAFDGLAIATANAEQNLRNVRALFESHLQSVFTRRGKGWAKLQLVSVCDLFVDSAHRTPKYQDDGIPALRPRDVVSGKLNLEGALRVCEEEYEIQSKRYKPKPGDIVYSRELSYGWAALLPRSPRVCLSQGMCLFRPSSKLDASFLLYVLNGSIGREQATRAAVGAAHPHINLGDIKSYTIPMPPLEIQRQITEQLNALREETQRLEAIYRHKLAALGELKRSLLHQAFSGQL